MSRVVIKVQSDQNGQTKFCLEPSPGAMPPGAGKLYPFRLPTAPDPFHSMRQGVLVPAVIREAGVLLFKKLSMHPAIKTTISSALTQNTLHPIYIYLQSESAESLPWECLCDPATGEFLALDPRWPVGRIVDSSDLAIERAVEPPVKLTAILAAAGAVKWCYGDACHEWEALYNAVSAAKFGITLQIFVADGMLEQHIRATNLSPHVTIERVDPVPRQENIQDLFNAINGFGPNILHLYCHGSSSPSSHLELASQFDYEAPSPYGSIDIDASQLWSETQLEPYIWLVTLNCCQGATPAVDAYSLAGDLVARGFPAVVGMREAVASLDAHAFCEAFYRSLFSEIQGFLHLGRVGVKVEWARLMHMSRKQLCHQHANNRPRANAEGEAKEWTLPAVYIRPRDFKLRGPSTHPTFTATEKQERQVLLDQLTKKREEAELNNDPVRVIQSHDREIRKLEDELYPQTGA